MTAASVLIVATVTMEVGRSTVRVWDTCDPFQTSLPCFPAAGTPIECVRVG